MPEDERVNFNPASLLPKEIWLEPEPPNWKQPEKIYPGSTIYDNGAKDIWYNKY